MYQVGINGFIFCVLLAFKLEHAPKKREVAKTGNLRTNGQCVGHPTDACSCKRIASGDISCKHLQPHLCKAKKRNGSKPKRWRFFLPLRFVVSSVCVELRNHSFYFYFFFRCWLLICSIFSVCCKLVLATIILWPEADMCAYCPRQAGLNSRV